MKTNQTMFNYSDDFGIGPAIELLVHGNCNAGGGIFTFVGSSVVPVTNGDQLICDKTLNMIVVVPRTDAERFASTRWMFMSIIANTLSQYCSEELSGDMMKLTNQDSKIVGVSAAKVTRGIGILYCSLYLADPHCKSGKNYGVSHVDITDDKFDAVHDDIEKVFRNMQATMLQQELQILITDINS